MLQIIRKNLWVFVSLPVFIHLSFLMVKICLNYLPWSNETNFLVLKQDVVHTQPWRIAFQVHVFTSSFALLAGLTQFFPIFRTNAYRLIHIYAGYFYLCSILLFALPSGFILALDALGGIWTQFNFILLSILWGISTTLALIYALKKQWIRHRNWMIRSFALTLSALTLRSWKLILYELTPYFDWLNPLLIYQIQSWLGWTINLLVAEIIILKLNQKNYAKKGIHSL